MYKVSKQNDREELLCVVLIQHEEEHPCDEDFSGSKQSEKKLDHRMFHELVFTESRGEFLGHEARIEQEANCRNQVDHALIEPKGSEQISLTP